MARRQRQALPDQRTKKPDAPFARWELPVVLLSLLLLVKVFAPYAVWRSNASEFKFPFLELLPYLGDLHLLLLAGAAAVVLWFTPLYLQRFASALATALFAVAFIEFHFFVGETALIGNSADGFTLDTSGRALPVLIYASILIVFVILRRRSAPWRALTLALLVFLVLQSGTILFDQSAAARRLPSAKPTKTHQISTFSSTENIIHIILDELQSTFFLDVLDSRFPGARDRLNGFTYYRDHLGAYPTTRSAVGYFFSGRLWENRVDLDTWRQEGLKGTMFDDLVEAGYRVDAVTFPSYSALETTDHLEISRIPIPYTGADSPLGVAAEKRAEANLLNGVAMSRLTPDLLRKRLADTDEPLGADRSPTFSKIETYLRQRLSSNVAFFDTLIREVRVGDDKPRYKLLHFVTTHNPASLEADCSLSPKFRGGKFEDFVPQTECALGQLFRFLTKLEQLDVYDSATIIVHADHGKRVASNCDRHLERAFYGGVQTPKIYPYVMAQIICSALPLMMIKPSGAHGRLQISDAPVWYADIPATIRDAAGIDLGSEERSIMDAQVGDRRNRYFYYYHYGLRERLHDRVVKYEVTGPGWDLESWKKVDEVVWDEKDYRRDYVDMGSAEHRYFERDWWLAGKAKGQRTVGYTMGPSASIALDFAGRRPQKLLVHMGSPFVDQTVDVFLAGRSVGRIELQSPEFSSYELPIPGEVSADLEGLVELEFRPGKFRQTWPAEGKAPRSEVGVAIDWIRYE